MIISYHHFQSNLRKLDMVRGSRREHFCREQQTTHGSKVKAVRKSAVVSSLYSSSEVIRAMSTRGSLKFGVTTKHPFF